MAREIVIPILEGLGTITDESAKDGDIIGGRWKITEDRNRGCWNKQQLLLLESGRRGERHFKA